MARSGPVTKDTSTVALGLAQIRVGNAASNITSIAPVFTSANSIGALASTKYTGNVDYWKLESGFPLLEDMTIPLRESSMLECEFKEISSYNLALARGLDPGAGTGASASVEVNGSVTTAGTTTGNIAVTDTAGPVNDRFTVVFTVVLGATTASVYGNVTGHVGDIADISTVFEPDNSGNPYFSIPANFFSGTWAADETFAFTTTAYVAAGGDYADPHAGEIKLGTISAPAYVRMEAVYTYPNGTSTMTIIFPRANVVSSVEIDMQAEDNVNVPLTFEAKSSTSEVAGGNVAWDDAPLGRIIFN